MRGRRQEDHAVHPSRTRRRDARSGRRVPAFAQADRRTHRGQRAIVRRPPADRRRGRAECEKKACAEQFGPVLEAERRGFPEDGRRVILGDGAAWIWNVAAEMFPGALQIVDLFHAKEHLWEVSKALHCSGGRSWPAACRPYALWTPPATSDCPHPGITTAAAARAVSAAPCRRPARRCPTALPAGLRPRRAGSPRLRRSGSHAGRSRHLHRLGRRPALPPAAPGDRTEPFPDPLFRPLPQPGLEGPRLGLAPPARRLPAPLRLPSAARGNLCRERPLPRHLAGSRQLAADVWAAHKFGGARLGDVRLGKRLVQIVQRQGEAPTKSFPGAAQNDQAAVRGYYRLIDHPADSEVTPENILAPHRQRTLQRMQGEVAT